MPRGFNLNLFALGAMCSSPSFRASIEAIIREEERIIGLAHLFNVPAARIRAEAAARQISIEHLYRLCARGEIEIKI